MGDLRSSRVIITKGVLFVVIGVLCTAMIAAEALKPDLALAPLLRLALHITAVWAFCRAYYFAFYVIEKYIDPGYRFAGLLSAIRWLVRSAATRQNG